MLIVYILFGTLANYFINDKPYLYFVHDKP